MTSADPSGRHDLARTFEEYVDALGRSSMRDAVRLVADLARAGVPVARIVGEVLAPAQVEVGRRWEQGTWSVAQEHTATGITEVALQTAVLSAGIADAGPDRPSLVLACADGEWHALSARMAAEVLRAEGVDVTYVGASLPSESLGEFLASQGATALGLSCSTVMTLVGARETIVEAHAAGLPVLVAGTAFGGDDRRAGAIGADAWVGTPGDAVAVLRRWQGSPPSPLGTARDPGGDEWVRLAAAPSEWVDATMDRLLARRPGLASVSDSLLARLRKEVAYVLRSLAAAQLTGDPSVVRDYTAWLRGVMAARRVPVHVLDDLFGGLADVLETCAPMSAEVVTDLRSLLQMRAVAGRGDPGRHE